jgi:hypothetical protein
MNISPNGSSSVVLANASGNPVDLYVLADDNIFAYGSDYNTPPLINSPGLDSCFNMDFFTTLYISYVSRNIRSYKNAYEYDPLGAVPIEMTGEASSLASLGVAGYGLNEKYNVLIAPYNI